MFLESLKGNKTGYKLAKKISTRSNLIKNINGRTSFLFYGSFFVVAYLFNASQNYSSMQSQQNNSTEPILISELNVEEPKNITLPETTEAITSPNINENSTVPKNPYQNYADTGNSSIEVKTQSTTSNGITESTVEKTINGERQTTHSTQASRSDGNSSSSVNLNFSVSSPDAEVKVRERNGRISIDVDD